MPHILAIKLAPSHAKSDEYCMISLSSNDFTYAIASGMHSILDLSNVPVYPNSLSIPKSYITDIVAGCTYYKYLDCIHSNVTVQGAKHHLLKFVKKKSGLESSKLISIIPAPCAPSTTLIELYFRHNAAISLTGNITAGNDDILSNTVTLMSLFLSIAYN